MIECVLVHVKLNVKAREQSGSLRWSRLRHRGPASVASIIGREYLVRESKASSKLPIADFKRI